MTTAQAVPLKADTSILSTRNVLLLIGVWLVYKFLEALYNVSPFHPLSSIPGPKLAAASYLPEFYHDVIRFGCYSKEIREMHKKYGKSCARVLSGRHGLIRQAQSSASTPTKYTAPISLLQTKSTQLVDASAISLSIRSMGQRL
jgi:hypothetical protein